MAIGGRHGYTGIPPGNVFLRNSAKFGWDLSLDQLDIVLRLAGLFPENARVLSKEGCHK